MEVNQTTMNIDDPVFQIVVSPNYKHDRVLFSARKSGLYRSMDGGKNWQYVFGKLSLQGSLAVTALAVSPHFAVDGHVYAASPGGILRSVDAGESWTVAMLPPPAPFVSVLILSPNYKHDGILFAGTMDDGVFRSTNRGATWSPWNFGLFDPHILSIAISPRFDEDKTIVLGTESCIFLSKNGGLGWRELSFPVEYAPVLSLAFSPAFPEDSQVFAGTESAGLYRSVDLGITWQSIAPISVVGSVDALILSQAYPESGEILIASADRIMLSGSQGQTWGDWNDDITFDGTILSIAAPEGIGKGSRLVVGSSDGRILHVDKK